MHRCSTRARFRRPLSLAALFFVSACGIAGAQVSIHDLGPGQAYSISTDGFTVVGRSGAGIPFRWTLSTGMVNLPFLPSTQNGEARGVSADGSVIVGTVLNTNTNTHHACRWTSSGVTDLGTIGIQQEAVTLGISGDGNTVVGGSGPLAFRWTSAGMQAISGAYAAYAANYDGSIIVGQSNANTAFRWTAAGGLQNLGALIPGGGALATAMTPDGNTIVGSSTANGSVGHVFRWTSAGGMQDLGQIMPSDGGSGATGVSADGSIVIGSGYLFPVGDRALLWTQQAGLVDLNTYLPSLGLNLSGWTLEAATGISADGRKIAGYGIHNGSGEAFLLTIPSPGAIPAIALAALSSARRRRH